MRTINLEKPPNILEEKKTALTKLETVFNRVFAVILILTTAPLLLNILTIPTIVLFILFSALLCFGKKYHPFLNIIFLIFALGVYFIPLPIGWGLFLSLREWRMDGFILHPVVAFFYLAPSVFVSLAIRNVLGNILVFFKPSLRWRNLLFFISLITVMAIILAYPLLSSIKLRQRAMENTTGNSKLSLAITRQELKVLPGESSGSTRLSRRVYTANFDSINDKYVYRLRLEDPLSESITFAAIKADGEKINFTTDNRIKCLNCQKEKNDPFGLIFPADKDVDFVITSSQWIKTIQFNEAGDTTAEFVFWK